MISVVSHAAESHFYLILDRVTLFSAAFTRDWSYQGSTGWKVKERGACWLAFLFWASFHFYTCSSHPVAAAFRLTFLEELPETCVSEGTSWSWGP